MARIDIRQTASLAALVTASVFIVSWIFGKLDMLVQPLFSAIQPVSVVTGTTGQKVLGWISGIIPLPEFMGTGVVITFVSAMVAIAIGTYAVDNLKVPVFKNFIGFNGQAGRIASILIWGAVPVYLVLIGFTLPSIGVVMGVLLHVVAVAFISVWLSGVTKIRI